ncbi:type VI secretion system contractile sheath domain-containing protein [Desulfovibrio inopinatus]|uniref:type VI secretion system contractile sheath domain-containing protein n=1 Tax=Desulfovibrio inopinatus TaxID=102109 RepID=UPI0004085DDC|nr:type VI secretion system contractile sheath large subunit [Desulfovibrio inopinatus]
MPFPEIPYSILVLAPFNPVLTTPSRRIAIDDIDIDTALAELGPTLRIDVPQNMCPDGYLSVPVTSIKSLAPTGVIANTDYLAQVKSCLDETKAGIGQPNEAAVLTSLASKYAGLPLDFPAAGQADASSQPSPAGSGSAIDDILSMVAAPTHPTAPQGGLAAVARQAEQLLARLLELVFADPNWRASEAAWRGLKNLLTRDRMIAGHVRVSIMSTTQETLLDAVAGLTTQLIESPPNLVLVDFAFDNAPARTEILAGLASFAETLLCPVVISLGAKFFQLNTFAELDKVQYIKHSLDDAAYAKWRTLAKQSGAGWILAAVNSFVLRLPFSPENPARPVAFLETDPLWINPTWAVGALIAESQAQYGWPSRFTDYNTIQLGDLPVLSSEHGALVTQAALSDDRAHEFRDAGMCALIGPIMKDFAIIPLEVAVDGESIAFKCFLSRLFSFLFAAKDALPELDYLTVAQGLTKALSLFFEQTGHQTPTDLVIHADQPAGGAIPLSITFTPPATILRRPQPVSFSFSW